MSKSPFNVQGTRTGRMSGEGPNASAIFKGPIEIIRIPTDKPIRGLRDDDFIIDNPEYLTDDRA